MFCMCFLFEQLKALHDIFHLAYSQSLYMKLAYILGVGQVGFWSSQAKSSIFENQNFKFKYCSSQILAKSSRVKY